MTYSDSYTLEEFALISGVRQCHRRTARSSDSGNYESHQPCTYPIYGGLQRPVGRYEIHTGFDVDLRTVRCAAALKVLEIAYEYTLKKYPDWLDHEWVMEDPGWRTLRFRSIQRHFAEDYCDSLVREIADRGEIALSESMEIKDGRDKNQKLLLIVDVPELDQTTRDRLLDGLRQGILPPICEVNRRVRYDELAPHFVRLDARLLSLLNGTDGWPSLSQADHELWGAAANLDLCRMDQAMARGANIHALDQGENVLTHMIQEYPRGDRDVIANISPASSRSSNARAERLLTVIDWLLHRGADINLFGFEGLAPLSAAVLAHAPQVVRFLLTRGAIPLSNQFPEELPWIPTALYYSSGDLDCEEEGSEEIVDVWEIVALIDVAILENRMAQCPFQERRCETIDSTPMWVNRIEAAYLVALGWNCRNTTVLEPFLTEKVQYEHPTLREPMQGKSAVVELLSNQFNAFLHQPRTNLSAELAVTAEGPFVILTPSNSETSAQTCFIETREGQITRISVRENDVASQNARRTGIIPQSKGPRSQNVIGNY